MKGRKALSRPNSFNLRPFTTSRIYTGTRKIKKGLFVKSKLPFSFFFLVF